MHSKKCKKACDIAGQHPEENEKMIDYLLKFIQNKVEKHFGSLIIMIVQASKYM